jgi:hypothetical protein
MANMRLVAYCGLYCGLCGERNRIPVRAKALREAMVAEGYAAWGSEVPGCEGFWSFLGGLCDPETTCPGCRGDGGPPRCAIRACAREKGVEVCVRCGDFPCERVQQLAQGYPTLVADARRLERIGHKAWIEEQERRAETGFCYADIRCHPYTVPEGQSGS